MLSDLVLRRPVEDEEEEFLRAHRATSPGYPSFLHYYEPGMSFRRYLEVLADQERGINLPSSNAEFSKMSSPALIWKSRNAVIGSTPKGRPDAAAPTAAMRE